MKIYSTRFQGSKRRVLPWLLEKIHEQMPVGTVYDAFSGSGIVSYALAKEGYTVLASDRLRSAEISFRAFVGNSSSLQAEEIQAQEVPLSDPLFRAFRGVFFPDNELRWLLGAASWGRSLRGDRRAAFFWALFQAALAKRPYNLFHRSNLSMRTSSVQRTFGNARTWERSFQDLLQRFLREQKNFRLEESGGSNFYLGDIEKMPKRKCDLLYLDPPYVPLRGEPIDYLDFYGFLDLLLCPSLRIDRSRQHLPLRHKKTSWEKRDRFEDSLLQINNIYSDTPLLLSYRKDGYPSPERILEILGPGTSLWEQPIHYALAKKSSAEIIFWRPA